MPRKDRTIHIPVAAGVEVVYYRSSTHPIEYAITLRIVHEGTWHTIFLVDNAHSPEEHHAHPYIGDCKQSPFVFGGDTNTVMNDAINILGTCWRTFFDAWIEAR